MVTPERIPFRLKAHHIFQVYEGRVVERAALLFRFLPFFQQTLEGQLGISILLCPANSLKQEKVLS